MLSFYRESLFNKSRNDETIFVESQLGACNGASGWRVFSPASTATLAQSGKAFGSTYRLQTGVVAGSNSDEPSVKGADAVVRELSTLWFCARKASKDGGRAE